MLRRETCLAPLSFTTVPARLRLSTGLMALGAVVLFAASGFAQTSTIQTVTAPSVAGPPADRTPPALVTCTSELVGRRQCAADTSAGVVLVKSIGPLACLLGKTWGYDNAGVWVADGCGGEFQLGLNAGAAQAARALPSPGLVAAAGNGQ